MPPNLGLSKMAVTCSAHSEGRLHWMSDWHVREETYAKALAEVVNLQHRIPLACYWLRDNIFLGRTSVFHRHS